MLDVVGLNYDEMLLQLASGDGMLPKSFENIQPPIAAASNVMQKRNLAIIQAISEAGFENAQNANSSDMATVIVNENDKRPNRKKGSQRLKGGSMPNNGNIFKGCLSAVPRMGMSLQNQWSMMQGQQMQMQLMRNHNNAPLQWPQQQQLQQDYVTQQMQYGQINQPSSSHGGMSLSPIPPWAYSNGSLPSNLPPEPEERTMYMPDNTSYTNGSIVSTPYQSCIHSLPCRSCDNTTCKLKQQKIPKRTVDATTSTTAQQSLTCNSSCISINETSLKETSSELVMKEYERRRGGHSLKSIHLSKAELLEQLEELKRRLKDKESGRVFKYKNSARSRDFGKSFSSVFSPKNSVAKAASVVTPHQRTYKPYIYPSDSPFVSENDKSQMFVNYTPVRGTKSEAETRQNAKTHATFSDSKMLKKRSRHQNKPQQQQSASNRSQQKVVPKHKSHHSKSKKKTCKTSKTKTKDTHKEVDNAGHLTSESKGAVKLSFKPKESIIWTFKDNSNKVNSTKTKKRSPSKKSSKHKKSSILHYVDAKKSIRLQYKNKPDTMIFNDVSHKQTEEDTMLINGKKPVNIYVHYR